MMDMRKGYTALLLLLALLLLTGCGARLNPVIPTEPTATPGEVPPPPTPTPLLSPPPEAVPSGPPVTTPPTPTPSPAKAPAAEGKHYPPSLPQALELEGWDSAAETAVRVTTYTVRSGDCLWSIAEALYGDGLDWRGIWEENRETVEDPGLVLVGQLLRLPEAGE